MNLVENAVKNKLASGRVSIGGWNMIGHPVVAEILAQAGFDWVAIDLEHGVIGFSQLAIQVMAVQAGGCIPLCRLPANEAVYFKWALDAGAAGVIVPMIKTAEEAHRAVESAKYPPLGERGIGVSRAHAYGAGFDEYVQRANAETLVVLQIEHIQAVENIERICQVPGVDALLIGPHDLAGSLGLIGQIDHPQVDQALRQVLEAALACGVAPGVHIVSPQAASIAARIRQGFRLIGLGLDTVLLSQAARALVEAASPSNLP